MRASANVRRKPTNVSRERRLRRPQKPEFALAGILVGLFAGEAIAVVVEVALAHPSRWIMLGGGIAGGALGSIAEIGRYCWRRHKWRAAAKS